MAMQFSPVSTHRHNERPQDFDGPGFKARNARGHSQANGKEGGRGADNTENKEKAAVPTTLLNENMHDAEANCLELAIRDADEDDTLVFLEDLHNIDGNRAGHVLVRDGETGLLRDPGGSNPNREFEDVESWIRSQRTNSVQPDPYVKSGELDAGEVQKLMQLSPEERREYVANSGSAELQALANERFADDSTGNEPTKVKGGPPVGTMAWDAEDDRNSDLNIQINSLSDQLENAATGVFVDSDDAGEMFNAGDAARAESLNELSVISGQMRDLTSALAEMRANGDSLLPSQLESLKTAMGKYAPAMQAIGERMIKIQLDTTEAVASGAAADNLADDQAKLSKDWAIAGAIVSVASLGMSAGTAAIAGAGNSMLGVTKATAGENAKAGVGIGLEATGAARSVWIAAQDNPDSTTEVSAISEEDLTRANEVIGNMGGLMNELELTNTANGGATGLNAAASYMKLGNKTLGNTFTAAGEEAIALSQLQGLHDVDNGGPGIGVVDKDGYYVPELTIAYEGRGTANPYIENLPEDAEPSDYSIVKKPQVKGAIAVLESLGYQTRQTKESAGLRTHRMVTDHSSLEVWNVTDEQFDAGGVGMADTSAGLTVWGESLGLGYGRSLDRVDTQWRDVDTEDGAQDLWSAYNRKAYQEMTSS